MIVLKNVNDKLRIITSSTADLDVYVGYNVIKTANRNIVNPVSKGNKITTATTTNILTVLSNNDSFYIKTLTVRNIHNSTSNTVSIVYYDGTNSIILFKVTLTAGQSIIYDEINGFSVLDSSGKQLSNVSSTSSILNELNVAVLAADVINADATPDTIADVTGLSFPVIAGETYWFRFVIKYDAAATTTGSRWSINGPANPTALHYTSQYPINATSLTVNNATAYDIPAAANASSLTTGNIAIIEGIIKPSANGTVIARFASEVTESAITAKAGSILQWARVL